MTARPLIASRYRRFASGLAAIIVALTGAASLPDRGAAGEFVLFEEPGCTWCATWQDEIGVVYHKTDEGRRAPLRRVDKTAERPADLAEIGAIPFSPTFVLVEDGVEVGRIVGYPGEHFFWPMLQELLARLDGLPEGPAGS